MTIREQQHQAADWVDNIDMLIAIRKYLYILSVHDNKMSQCTKVHFNEENFYHIAVAVADALLTLSVADIVGQQAMRFLSLSNSSHWHMMFNNEYSFNCLLSAAVYCRFSLSADNNPTDKRHDRVWHGP